MNARRRFASAVGRLEAVGRVAIVAGGISVSTNAHEPLYTGERDASALELRQPSDARARIDALLEIGKLDDAERAARAGGPATTVALAEILAYRGRLTAADSVLNVVLGSSGRRGGAGAGAGAGADAAAGSAAFADIRSARALSAELASRRGDRSTAVRLASSLVADFERNASGWSARDLIALGRAFLLLAERDAGAVRSALRAFDAAAATDPALVDAPLRASDLLLEKYNAPDARQGYEGVLQRREDHPRALLGLARVEDFEGKGTAIEFARRALAGNPSLTGAHLFLAKLHLEAEADDSARAAAARALAIDSSAVEGWATIGAVAWLRGDSAGFRDARAQAARLNPRPSAFYVTLADAASRQRRYADAARFSAQALALDSLSVPALGALGTNRLRAGDIAGGRELIERAFEIDPFNLWHKNTLDLLDELATFKTVPMGRFTFVAPEREADLLLPYLSPLLEEAYEKLAARYNYRPQPPVRLELYERHADFSVRTVGLAGLGALGVSFGRVLAMDAPSARERGTFNWGSTAWHELAHTFTLGLSGNRVPRWFSEGASVLEERRARPGLQWGADVSPDFIASMRAGTLRPVSALNDGFVRPRNPGEVLVSYYHASLVCEMIEAEFGPSALGDMLRAWGEGLETGEVFQRVLKIDEPTMDRRFNEWLEARFRRRIDPDTLRRDAALEPLEALADARERAGDDAGLAAALERMIWIWPYDQALHERLAATHMRLGNAGLVVRERRAIVALGPTDVLDARYELARALLAAGDRAGARREVLGVLEQAPTFEKAQGLLLELRERTP